MRSSLTSLIGASCYVDIFNLIGGLYIGLFEYRRYKYARLNSTLLMAVLWRSLCSRDRSTRDWGITEGLALRHASCAAATAGTGARGTGA